MFPTRILRSATIKAPLLQTSQPVTRLHFFQLSRHNVARRTYNGGRSRYQRFQQGSSFFQRWASRPTFFYEVTGVGCAVGGFYVYNLEVVPVSGRRRFNIVSPELEKGTAKEQYQVIMQEYQDQILPEWDTRTRQVQKVLDRLIPSSGLTGEKWEVHVIDDPQKNAFVLPGGKVFVFSGILPICAGEDGLAVVLGHEIAHNLAHHAAERMSSSLFLIILTQLISLFYGIPPSFSMTLTDIAFARPGSRKQEAEADYIGLMMMAQSCYNPEAAVGIWQRMEESERAEPPQFLSTHPSHHNRQQKIREWQAPRSA